MIGINRTMARIVGDVIGNLSQAALVFLLYIDTIVRMAQPFQ